MEEWRPISGFEGLYEVSDVGRIRSLDRTILVSPEGKREYSLFFEGTLMKQGDAPKGYKTVVLSKDGKPHTRNVHKLVAVAFLGDRTKDGLHVAHINGLPHDNRVENLEWKTPGDNNRDKRQHGTDHLVNRTHCPANHLLEYPNLRKYDWEKFGHRKCLACHRAKSFLRKRPDLTFEDVIDEYYSKIMNTKGDT